MTRPDRPARRGPKRRSDTTRPASARSTTRVDADRRPYPTAPTRTKASPAGSRPTAAGARSRGSAATPTPATVWACGPTSTDPEAAWPTPIVDKIVTSFSEPGGRVVLLPGPTITRRPAEGLVGSDGVIDHAPGTEPDGDLAAALETIEAANRATRVIRLAPAPTTRGPASRPFWADLVGDADGPVLSAAPPLLGVVGHGAFTPADDAAAGTDLIITSLPPAESGDHTSDLMALSAARLLRVGGILVVLTHSDWSRGELVDPTGAVVAAGQNADLLYLQHIVALHAPIRDGHFVSELTPAAAAEETRTRHRALVRGLPAPHRRVHSDVLVFAQPHDHEPPPLTSAGAVVETGVIR